MDASQFAVYQMKPTPAYRHMRFRPYKELQDKGIRVGCGDYVQAYLGYMSPQETPEDIRHRLCKQLPRNFRGHSISTGDVFVLNRAGAVVSYYVEKESFTVLADFFHNTAAPLFMETSNYRIEGKNGRWNAIDSVIVEGREFFLMEHDDYGFAGACVILDENGKLVVDGVQNGFDASVMRQLADCLRPPGQDAGGKAGENSGGEEYPPGQDAEGKAAENSGERWTPEQDAEEKRRENGGREQLIKYDAGEKNRGSSVQGVLPGQAATEELDLKYGLEKQPPGQAAAEHSGAKGSVRRQRAMTQPETKKDTAVQKKEKKAGHSRTGGKRKKRASVLEKLRRKQAEIAARGRQQTEQAGQYE